MTKLISLQEAQAMNLSREAQQLQKGRTEGKISETPEKELLNFTRTLILDSAARMGQKNISPEVTKHLLQDLLDAFINKFRGWSKYEITEAFKLGAQGKLDTDDVALSARTCFNWLHAYQFEIKPKLNKEIAQANAKQETPKELPPPSKKIIIDCFNRYKDGHEVLMVPAYERAEQLGYIDLSIERKLEILEQAKKEIIQQAQKKDKAGLFIPLLRARMEQIKALGPKDKAPEYLKAEAKRLALKDWFQGMIDLDMDIKDFIEEGGDDANQ